MSVERVTRVVVNVTRHETCVYEFEGAVDASCVEDLIRSGEYDPDESRIHSEDLDVVDLRVMTR